MMGAAPASQDGETFDPIASIRVWNRSRETARTLASIDDRQLTDIGIVRGDIDWVAEELAIRSLWPANREPRPQGGVNRTRPVSGRTTAASTREPPLCFCGLRFGRGRLS